MDTTLLNELGFDKKLNEEFLNIIENLDIYKKTLHAMGYFPEFEISRSEGSNDVIYSNNVDQEEAYADLPENY